ncbi:hypothetical protein CCMSSC00406_0009699 [Pleurotus cornucopiae]|uniref:Uncharacterized protein n=1 Tax=Pleurotus cornucopiae TaxID=5321 RepID=A0ACB7J9M5_PLECO|nr:hypothetical protein CCMSSC00406_0009699 [Pleurotus cornucopiae]
MFRVFLGAPTKNDISKDPASFRWQTVSSTSPSASTRPAGTQPFPPATLQAASVRISQFYKHIIFDDEEGDEGAPDGTFLGGQTTAISWDESLEDGEPGAETIDKSKSAVLSRDDTYATQEEETQEISAYSSDASSIIRFPSFTFDLHTLLKLAKVSKKPAYSKASVLAAVLEIEGPDVIHIKKGLDAGKEVSLLKMILGDDEGSVCKLTAWREIAECWGAEDASGIKRGDVVFLENLSISKETSPSSSASTTLTASPNLKSRLQICFRTMPSISEDMQYRPDLRLGYSDATVRKIGMELPTEILFAIVGEVSDVKTLSKLLLVSRQFNSIALRQLYEDMSFSLNSAADLRSINTLRRDVQANPGIQLTTSFATYYFPRAYYAAPPHVEPDVDHIIPYLVNVRRLRLSRQAASPGVLSLLPASAHLTHLILDRRLCSGDLTWFFSSHPTLESIMLSGSSTNGHIIELTSDALPTLRTLAIVFDASLRIKNTMPSVLNLTIFRHSDGPAVIHTVGRLPSTRTLALQDASTTLSSPGNFNLPNLEYLQINFLMDDPRPAPSILSKFATTKLKYVRFLESRGLDARRIFESVPTLVVMDVVRDADETLRWVRGSDFPLEIGTFDEDADSWGQWWEHAGKEVEHICK